MSATRILFRLSLPDAQLAALDDARADGFYASRAQLIEAILSEWLAGPKKLLKKKPLKPDLAASAEVKERMRILTQWRSYCRARPHARCEATTIFLEQFNRHSGMGLSRRTLYQWANSYRRHGMAGLLDGRRRYTAGSKNRPSKAVQNDIAASSKEPAAT